MAIFWTILQIFTILFYKNLHKFNSTNTQINSNVNIQIEEEQVDERTSLLDNNATNSNDGYNAINYDEIIRVNQNKEEVNNNQLSDNLSQSNRLVNSNSVRIVDNSETDPLFVRLYKEYVREG
jgi:hypothetical protein